MKTLDNETQTPQTNVAREQTGHVPGIPSKTAGNVYWRDLDPTKDLILDKGTVFVSPEYPLERVIYWHGHEASEAQNWLSGEAAEQSRSGLHTTIAKAEGK